MNSSKKVIYIILSATYKLSTNTRWVVHFQYFFACCCFFEILDWNLCKSFWILFYHHIQVYYDINFINNNIYYLLTIVNELFWRNVAKYEKCFFLSLCLQLALPRITKYYYSGKSNEYLFSSLFSSRKSYSFASIYIKSYFFVFSERDLTAPYRYSNYLKHNLIKILITFF